LFSELVIEVEDFSSLSVLLGGGHTGGSESIFSIDSVEDIVVHVDGGDDGEGFRTDGNFSVVFFTPSFISFDVVIVRFVFVS